MTTLNSITLTPGFMVLHSNRLEDLRDLLTQFLKSRPLSPLSAEVVLVQSNGMKHWLEMALADDAALGVCAATRMELPSGYLWQIYRQVLGADAVPHQMCFEKKSLVWRLVRLLPILAASNVVYAPLHRYLSDPTDGRKLYQLAMQVADVFDGYQSYRADWLSDWADGNNILRTHHSSSTMLEETHEWQAQLWRDIREDVGAELADASRSSVHAAFMQAIRALIEHSKVRKMPASGLPSRIIVFGISSLPLQIIEALAELGQVCQVLMLVQNPCQYYWGDIVEGHELLRQQMRRRQKDKPVGLGALAAGSQHSVTQPLLASLGKQGRDYLHMLDDFDSVDSYKQHLTRVDAFVDPIGGVENPSQLAQLQSAILNLQPQPDEPQALEDDASIILITTHSAQREVEVLHDRLLAWFDADDGLDPRDVMVMVPDIEVFAPHIQAVFGRFSPGQPRYIPYSVADTTPRQSPLVQALSQLLSLTGSRLSLADWLSLFEVDAVRKRFGLTQANLEQINTWLNLAGVRWGLDANHRKDWGVADSVEGMDQNTWAFGLRRLLLGYAVGNGEAWENTLPQAAISGLDASLIGPLLEWLEAISLTLVELSNDKTPVQWSQTIADIVVRFFEASDDAEDRLIQYFLELLEEWQQLCEDARLVTPITLDVVREHWLTQIQETGLHQRFFGGGVQFSTLMPMRSIPFKVICLLGMKDGDYPRQTTPRDFDLMAQNWRPGDRSRREDDRYLFLEAILSARKKLYISWQGHRVSDNAEQPPSVLVAQLIEHLNACWAPVRAPQQQPLQPFSEAYFLQGSPFVTYDKDWARMHEAIGQSLDSSIKKNGSTLNPLGSAVPESLTLDSLRQLLRQPVEVFFRARLGVKLDTVEELQQEAEPFALNGLEKYQIGDELLKACDAGHALNNLKMSGKLPMAGFGARVADEFEKNVNVVIDRRKEWQSQYPHALPAQSIALNIDGIAITGTLEGLLGQKPIAESTPDVSDHHAAGEQARWLQLTQRLGAVSEGKGDDLAARGHIVIGLWINHLAACASGMRLTSVQLGLDGAVLFDVLDKAEALSILQSLLRIYKDAWEKPLPVACKTAWAFLQAKVKANADTKPDKKPKDPHESAQNIFEGGFNQSGELVDSAYLARAFDGYAAIKADMPKLAESLYGDMFKHVRVDRNEGALE